MQGVVNKALGWQLKAGLRLLVVAYLGLASLALVAGESENSMVDQLEQELLKKEKTELLFNDHSLPPLEVIPQLKESLQSYRGSLKVRGGPESLESLHKINLDMAQLQGDIDQLTAKVEEVKQGLLQQTKLDNLVALELTAEQIELADVQWLEVKIDGFLVYEMSDQAGLWLSAQALPLYFGPMDIGSHRIDVAARIARKHEGKVPLGNGLFYLLNQSFAFDIPAGEVRSKWSVKLTAGSSDKEQVRAELIESQLTL